MSITKPEIKKDFIQGSSYPIFFIAKYSTNTLNTGRPF
jgi:hypothetical protein